MMDCMCDKFVYILHVYMPTELLQRLSDLTMVVICERETN